MEQDSIKTIEEISSRRREYPTWVAGNNSGPARLAQVIEDDLAELRRYEINHGIQAKE